MSFFKKKGWITFIIILVIALACAYISQMGSDPVSNAVNSVLTPIQTQLAKLTNPVKSLFDFIGDIKGIREENERLKSENIQLLSSLKTVEEYKDENERLQKLLAISDEMTQSETVAARVIAYEPDNWFSYVTINKGTASGIEISDAVITAQGLLGQVAEVGKNWAKVSTIINSESSAGVRIVRNGEIGIVEGDTALSKVNKCRLGYLIANASVMSGDILETSGLGGIFPPGLMVGKISDVQKDNMGRLDYAVVEPFVDFHELYEVLVITDWVLDDENIEEPANVNDITHTEQESDSDLTNTKPTPNSDESVENVG